MDERRDFRVHEIVALQKTNHTYAKELLHRLARQVQPIMRRRQWKVPLLSEFYPRNPALLGLNINGGGGNTKEIKVRLRPHGDPDSFLPEESVLGTLLHELVHNVQGPHNATFYKLLDEITAECEELLVKGITGTGQGFDAPSAGRLGSHSFIPVHNPPESSLRAVAAKAAEERAKKQRLMSSGPQKLGGDSAAAAGLTPAQAAAMAAERRAADNVWCPAERPDPAAAQDDAGGSNDAAAAAAPQQQQQQEQQQQQQEQRQQGAAAKRDVSEDGPIDLTMSDDEGSPAAAPAQRARPAAAPARRQAAGRSKTAAAASGSGADGIVDLCCMPGRPCIDPWGHGGKPSTAASSAAAGWTCPFCTLVNADMALQCDACLSLKPMEGSSLGAGELGGLAGV